MKREIELKLELAPEMVDRLRAHPPFARQPTYRQHQDTIYFDTPDRKLRKAGLTLRVRRCGRRYVQTVKAQTEAAGLFERDEWESQVRAMKPDLRAVTQTPVAKVLAEDCLQLLEPVATLSVNRTCWVIDKGNNVTEATLDEGVINAGDARQALSELELELKKGSEKALFRLCEQIADQVPIKLSVLSKADSAVGMADGELHRVRKASRIDLQFGMTAAHAFTAIVLSCLRHFRLNEPMVVESRTPEALHQAHVALRRLRSAFLLFRPVLRDSSRYRWIENELRWCSRRLGEARNVDVLLHLLKHASRQQSLLLHVRKKHYDAVIALLNSRRFVTMMLKLVRWLFIGKWRRSPRAQVPVRSLAEWRVEEIWAAVCDENVSLSEMTEEQRHRFRIRTKQFRYALEFVRSLLPNERRSRKPFQASLKSLQDNLGELNDLSIANCLAREIGAELAVGLLDDSKREVLLTRAQEDLSALRDIGPYWRSEEPRRPEAGAARPQGGEGPPAASRTHEPRSAECARG